MGVPGYLGGVDQACGRPGAALNGCSNRGCPQNMLQLHETSMMWQGVTSLGNLHKGARHNEEAQ